MKDALIKSLGLVLYLALVPLVWIGYGLGWMLTMGIHTAAQIMHGE